MPNEGKARACSPSLGILTSDLFSAMNATTFFPAKRRIGRRRYRATATQIPLAALVLVSAVLGEEDPALLTLAFDRAVDLSAFDGSQVIVNDGALVGKVYAATGPVTMLSPTTVAIVLVDVSEDYEPGVTLTASAATGIVAVDDGGAWDGVTDLALPFP